MSDDADYFFFRCALYTNQRIQLFTETRRFHPLSVFKLTIGIEDKPNADNQALFQHVQHYIKATNRFQ